MGKGSALIRTLLTGIFFLAGGISSALHAQCTRDGARPYLSAREVAQFAHQYFNPSVDTHPILGSACQDLVAAIAIATIESGRDPHCEEDEKIAFCDDKTKFGLTTDFGLWQSNDDRTHCAPAPAVCGVGSTEDEEPQQAAKDFACQTGVSPFFLPRRGFQISVVYNNRFGRFVAAWQAAVDEAIQASADFLAQDGCMRQVIDQVVDQSGQSILEAHIIGPQDPNDKAGSQGVGIGRYIAGQTPLRYAIFFGNEPTASAPAQKVVVTDQLNLATDDLATFSLGPIALPNQLVIPPSGLSDFSTTADLRPANNILVTLNAHLDKSTGLLTWTFQSLDPATNQPPVDPLAGFLPAGAGGSTFFTVIPKTKVPTDTQVQNHASVVFDTNPSISTPTWLNTIDKDAPQSQVLALPAQSSTSIPLQWAGTDVGAGVQDFTIYVSDNGGPFAPFLTQSTATSAAFPGQPGHTYAFFSTARDLVGNLEDVKTAAEATTTVLADAIPPTTVAVIAPPANTNGWNNTNVMATISATDNPGGSGVQQITFSATGGQPIPRTNVAGNSAIATIGSEGVTNLNFFATDFAQNVEPAHTLPIRIDKTPPSINGSRTPSANANGWNNTNVAVSFACADALSGMASGSPPANTLISSEGVNHQVSGICQDRAGNTASATVSGINIDKTPPVIAGLPAAGCKLTETSKLMQVATISSSDALSGLASFDVVVTSSQTSDDVNEPDIVITGSGLQPRIVQLRPKVRGGAASRTFTLTGTATDAAGNTINAMSTCTVPHDQGH